MNEPNPRLKLLARAPSQRVAVMFPFTEERPSLSRRTGTLFRVLKEMLDAPLTGGRLSDTERAAVLLNLCIDEVDRR